MMGHTVRMKYFIILILLFLKEVDAGANLYKTLGVAKDCSASDLKKAYRKKSLKHHPDKVPSDKRNEAEAKFKEINEAYDTLSDENKRKLYDQYGEAALRPDFQANPFQNQQGGFSFPQSGQQGESFHFFNMNQPNEGGMGGDILGDILRSMMGGGGAFGARQRRQQQRPKRSYTKDLYCSLEDLDKGVTKKLRVKHPVEINAFTRQQELREKIYKVHLTPGWKSGTKIKFPPADGFPAMTFVIREKKHHFLERRGNDLWFTCKITARQAEKGARIKIQLPNGEELNVTTQDHLPTPQGHTMTLKGKGMPMKGGPQRGNLVIEFHVLPQSTPAT